MSSNSVNGEANTSQTAVPFGTRYPTVPTQATTIAASVLPPLDIDIDQLVENTRHFLALNLYLRYQMWISQLVFPVVFSINQSFLRGQHYGHVCQNLRLYFRRVHEALEREYVAQGFALKQCGQAEGECRTPMDDHIVNLAKFLWVDEVHLRRYIELFTRPTYDVGYAFERFILTSNFEALANHIQADMQIINSPQIFTIDQEGTPAVLGFTETAPNPGVPAHPVPPLWVLINTLKQLFFNVPGRFHEDTRMWRATGIAIFEMRLGREGSPLPTPRLRRALQIAIATARPTGQGGPKRKREEENDDEAGPAIKQEPKDE